MPKVKREIELSEALLEAAELRCKQEGYPDFNSFLVGLIRKDAIESLPLKDRLDIEGVTNLMSSRGGN